MKRSNFRGSSEEAQTRRNNEIATAIMTALKTPSRPVKGETPTYPGTKIAEHAVYSPVTAFLDASDALVAEYQRLDNMVKDMQDDAVAPIAETMNDELQEATRQLNLGARVALRNVKKVLGMPRDADVDEDGDEEMRDVEREGEQVLSYEWQKSLNYVERGVKRMVKGLPDDEE
jgi:formiminotetrahydrofolate cyclodeaminase